MHVGISCTWEEGKGACGNTICKLFNVTKLVTLTAFPGLLFWSLLSGMTAVDLYYTDLLLDKFKSGFRFWSMELCIISCKMGESSSWYFPKAPFPSAFGDWTISVAACMDTISVTACTIWRWKSRNWSKQAAGGARGVDDPGSCAPNYLNNGKLMGQTQ